MRFPKTNFDRSVYKILVNIKPKGVTLHEFLKSCNCKPASSGLIPELNTENWCDAMLKSSIDIFNLILKNKKQIAELEIYTRKELLQYLFDKVSEDIYKLKL